LAATGSLSTGVFQMLFAGKTGHPASIPPAAASEITGEYPGENESGITVKSQAHINGARYLKKMSRSSLGSLVHRFHEIPLRKGML